MISIIIIYLAVKFGYPYLALAICLTWIPDVIIVAGIFDVIGKLIQRKK